MPEDTDPIVNPDELVEQAAEELEGIAPEETDNGEAVQPVAEEGGASAVAPEAPDAPDEATQSFFQNLQRLTQSQAEEFRTYDPEAEDLVSYTREASAHAARAAASDAFKAQQAFNMMIERVPQAYRDEVRGIVASDDAAMSNPRAVAQAVAAAIGLKVLSGNATKTTAKATAPQASRQAVSAAQPNVGSGDREYNAFLKAFGYTAKEYPYSRYKSEGVR